VEGVAPFCAVLTDFVPPDEREMLLGHLNRTGSKNSATDSPPTRGAGVRGAGLAMRILDCRFVSR
jgi:hypothetical protein